MRQKLGDYHPPIFANLIFVKSTAFRQWFLI